MGGFNKTYNDIHKARYMYAVREYRIEPSLTTLNELVNRHKKLIDIGISPSEIKDSMESGL